MPSRRRPRFTGLSLLSFSLGLVLPAGASTQETGTVTGLVAGTSGVPLAAAQVYIRDSGLGALTNEAGRFLILNVPVGEMELVVELLGHRTATRGIDVSAGVATVVDVTLTEAAIFLDEIVVTGTGQAMQKKRLGNTVATLDATKMANAPISSFSELLQAREPSVLALTSGGATGSGTRFRIRGSNSISMSNEPVVYVDGVRVDNSGDMEGNGRSDTTGSRLDDINWEAVERVEVLKGAAAATLYGSEASSGVIQVFTKSGSPGTTRFTARVEGGLLSTPDRIPANAGFARDAEQAARLSTLYGETIEPFRVFEKDFARDVLETGDFRTLSADVSGGDEQVRYFIGGRYAYEDGVLGAESLGPTRDQLTRIQGNASLTILPKEGLTFRLSTGYTDTGLHTFRRNNNIASALSMTQFGKPEEANCARSSVDPTRTFGESTPVCTGQGNPTGTTFGSLREFMQPEDFQDARHFSASVNGSWEGGPGLSVQALVGIDQVDEKWDRLWPFGWRVDDESGLGFPDEGFRFVDLRAHREITVDAKIAWGTDVGSDFRSELVVGGQRFSSGSEFIRDQGGAFPAPGVEVLQAGQINAASDFAHSKVSMGGYVQEQLGFREWLFGTVGARFDRTSAFGRDAGSAVYPKAGISALVSELSAWDVGWLPTLRLRAAIGRSGLQPGAFDKSTTYDPRQTDAGGGILPGNLGNPDLRPERTTEAEFGAEAEVLDGRLGLDVTYWDRTTHDALIPRSFPAAGGFTRPQLDNIGRLDASGWELRVNAVAIEGDHTSLTVFANAAYTSEIVSSMSGAPRIAVSGTYTRHRNVIEEGLPPGAFVGARMIPTCTGGDGLVCYDPSTHVPFDLDGDGIADTRSELEAYLTSADAIDLDALHPMLIDEDGDGDLLDHVLGKPTPDWQGAVGANLALGQSLSISTLFEYRAGNYSVSNLGGAFRNANRRNVREAAEVESTLTNPATRGDPEARLAAALKWANELASLFPSSGLNLLEPGDFVRWRELTVTYRIPDEWSSRAGLDDMTISLTGRNLALLTRYGGQEPEGNEMGRCGGGGELNNGAGGSTLQCNFLEATDMFAIPLPRRFALSVRVVF